jgi:hypothetical protein
LIGSTTYSMTNWLTPRPSSTASVVQRRFAGVVPLLYPMRYPLVLRLRGLPRGLLRAMRAVVVMGGPPGALDWFPARAPHCARWSCCIERHYPRLHSRMHSNVGRAPSRISLERGVPLEGGGVPIANLGRGRNLQPRFRTRTDVISGVLWAKP